MINKIKAFFSAIGAVFMAIVLFIFVRKFKDEENDEIYKEVKRIREKNNDIIKRNTAFIDANPKLDRK